MERKRRTEIFIIILFAGLVALTVLKTDAILSWLSKFISIVRPLIIGLFTAFVINLPMTFIEGKLLLQFPDRKYRKVIRPVAVILSLIFVIGLVALFTVIIIPHLISTVSLMTVKLPEVYQDAVAKLVEITDRIPQLKELIQKNIPDNMTAINRIIQGAGGVVNILFSKLGGFFGSLINVLIGLIISVYILLSKETLQRQGSRILYAYFKKDTYSRIMYVLRVINDTFAKFISGQVTESIVIGILTVILLNILRMPYATMIGAMTGFMSLVPIIGPTIGVIIGFLIIFTVNPVQAFIFLVSILILQQIDGNFIYPRIVGDSVGLPPLWVLFSVILGGGLFGIVGTLLAVPTFAVLYKLLREDVEERVDRRGKMNIDLKKKLSEGREDIR